jgi:hypothetical protein
MVQTVEAVVEAGGRVRLLGELRPAAGPRRAFVTVLEEPPAAADEAARLAEPALADWNRPEEDAAWSYLQPAK